MAEPRAPQLGSSAMGLGHSRALQTQELGHPMAEPPLGQGTPCSVPRQPLSTILCDVSMCLEGQTTSESNETRTVVSVSKTASQRFKNHIDRTSVLREKPRKPKDTHPKGPNDDA